MTQKRRVDLTARVQDDRLPWAPLALSNVEITAAKSLMKGENAVLLELMLRATGAKELEFRAEGERASAFASGKRWVLLELARIAQLPITDSLDKGTS